MQYDLLIRGGRAVLPGTDGVPADKLAWKPVKVRVVWADGAEHDAAVDPTRSTRPGAMKGGQVIRLVLRLDEAAPAGAPSRIELVSGARSVVVALEP